jgi:hypothetical protein
MPLTQDSRLQAYKAQIRQLAAQLSTELGAIEWLGTGSLVRRYTSCGIPGCRCQADPPQLHGPYWQWTKKVAGKTITRRLTDEQAALFQTWLEHRRHLRETLDNMEAISEKATALVLGETPPTRRNQPPRRLRSAR